MKQHALPLLVALLTLLAPIKVIAFAVGFMVLVDLGTGVWASARTGQGITSDRFGRSVRKSLVYLIALVVAQVAQAHVFENAAPIVKVVSGLIGSTELLSIFENLSRISGVDFTKALVEKILPTQREKKDRGEEP